MYVSYFLIQDSASLLLLRAGGITRVAKLLMAVATNSTQLSSVSFIGVDSDSGISGDSALQVHSVVSDVDTARSACTSLAFDNYSGHVAMLNDIGVVRVIDIESEKCIVQLLPDGAGVADLAYSRSGKMITLGTSPRGQLQLWDARGPRHSHTYAKMLSVALPAVSSYVCVATHATLEQYVYCGDSTGVIREVDLRTGMVASCFQTHNGPGIAG